MQKSFFQDTDFNAGNFAEAPLQIAEYDNCTFESCNFSGMDLSDADFEACEFINCDFSNAIIRNTAFKVVKFKSCKLIGLQFDECNSFLLEFQFWDCQLNLSSFYQVKMKATFFQNCMLHEVDFTETELSSSTFKNCDFSGAMFGNTNLEKADLTSSFNFSIDPEMNFRKNARFSTANISGLLDKYQISIK